MLVAVVAPAIGEVVVEAVALLVLDPRTMLRYSLLEQRDGSVLFV